MPGVRWVRRKFMTPRLSGLLDRLAPAVREEIRRDFAPNCCIATAAILRRVFRHFRFEALPVPVEVVIRNRRMVELLKRGVKVPGDPARMREWFKATGSYSVGITRESPTPFKGGGFSGHLVVRVQDVLVDASLEQANRPQWNLAVPPFMVSNIAPGFMEGKTQVGGVNGCEVAYTLLTGDSTWRSSPDWTDEDRARRAVNAIIARVRWSGTCPATMPGKCHPLDFATAVNGEGLREREGDYGRG